jgi:cob(I)alamin adenosyltransferase
MVYLNRIYTKSGDGGETSLGDGTRLLKTDSRIAAYGGTDELNSVLGVALTVGLGDEIAGWVRHVQNDLFDLGADLCLPQSDTPKNEPLRVTGEQIETLERWIDSVNERLEPLKSFILPGGSPAAAHLHHARSVCRRVEIAVVALAQRERINPDVAIYLNRLSDLLFVLARASGEDVLWIPGKHRNANR